MATCTLHRRVVFSFVSLMLAVIGAYAYPTIVKLGMTILKPGVQPGYVIFGAPDGNAYAIDTKGEVARKWPSPEPNTGLGYTRPLANGNLLARVERTSLSGAAGANTGADSVIEMDQDGRVVWRYSDKERSLHHDEERMANGNTMFVCSKELNVPAISNRILQDDCLIEVDPSGKIVWEWQTADHFDEFEFSNEVKAEILAGYGGEARLGLGSPPPAKAFDWAHMNAASPIPESAGHTDARFKPGNVIVSYRYINTLAVVDRETKKIVWKTVNLTIGQHNPHFLPSGVPGTGHILVFDNGNVDVNTNPRHASSRPNSRVLEINPLTMSIVWEYNAEKSNRPIWSFFSHYISSAQRQPNGNTLICEGANGRIFEVMPDGEIVWEYVNQYSNVTGKIPNNTIFRAAKVPESWLKRHSSRLASPF
jgi:outer membrane protein assembly factor BamB